MSGLFACECDFCNLYLECSYHTWVSKARQLAEILPRGMLTRGAAHTINTLLKEWFLHHHPNDSFTLNSSCPAFKSFINLATVFREEEYK